MWCLWNIFVCIYKNKIVEFLQLTTRSSVKCSFYIGINFLDVDEGVTNHFIYYLDDMFRVN